MQNCHAGEVKELFISFCAMIGRMKMNKLLLNQSQYESETLKRLNPHGKEAPEWLVLFWRLENGLLK